MAIDQYGEIKLAFRGLSDPGGCIGYQKKLPGQDKQKKSRW